MIDPLDMLIQTGCTVQITATELVVKGPHGDALYMRSDKPSDTHITAGHRVTTACQAIVRSGLTKGM